MMSIRFNEEIQKTILLDEDFVKEELAFYDGWLSQCNTSIHRILERKKKLNRDERAALKTLTEIRAELSTAEEEFKMNLNNFEESLKVVIDIAKNILRNEESYSASMGGIAKLWLKRLEPQLKKVS